jgi:outer membrane protein TolC
MVGVDIWINLAFQLQLSNFSFTNVIESKSIEAISTMRYFKSAAFLLAILSSSVPLLARTALAASEGSDAAPPSTEREPVAADLSSLLDGVQHETNRALLKSDSDSFLREAARQPASVPTPSTTAHEPRFLQVSALPQDTLTLSQAPDAASPEEDLPTLEEGLPAEGSPAEGAPPAAEGAPDILPGGVPASPADSKPANESDSKPPDSEPANGSASEPEINALPDSLLADPNPLSVPVIPEEVDIERNPVVTLEQAVELAYRNNQALQAALLTLEQAEAALQAAQASQLPTVSVGGNLTNSQQGSQESTTLGGSLEVGYDLLTGGQRSASIRAAEIQTQVSALTVESQQEQIRLDTANLYYALQESGEQIRINQSFVNEAERNLRDSELRQEVGVGTRFDVLRADVQLANAKQELVQSRFNQDISRRDIARLLNLPSTAGLQATPVAKAEPWQLDLEESILLAFQNRAELEQQLRQADLSEQQRQIALAAVRPQVSLFANYGLQTTLTSNFGASSDLNDSTSFGARFNMTLYDGGAARARARQEEIGGAIAEEQFSENLDQIRFDVEQSFFNLQANEENIATSKVAVAQAEEALNLANLRLQAGVGTQLDVLTAQSELTQAQVNNVTAILGYNRALAAMQRAVSNLGL